MINMEKTLIQLYNEVYPHSDAHDMHRFFSMLGMGVVIDKNSLRMNENAVKEARLILNEEIKKAAEYVP